MRLSEIFEFLKETGLGKQLVEQLAEQILGYTIMGALIAILLQWIFDYV